MHIQQRGKRMLDACSLYRYAGTRPSKQKPHAKCQDAIFITYDLRGAVRNNTADLLHAVIKTVFIAKSKLH